MCVCVWVVKGKPKGRLPFWSPKTHKAHKRTHAHPTDSDSPRFVLSMAGHHMGRCVPTPLARQKGKGMQDWKRCSGGKGSECQVSADFSMFLVWPSETGRQVPVQSGIC